MGIEVLDKLKAPAIALIIVGSLNGGLGLLLLLSGLARLAGLVNSSPGQMDGARQAGYLLGTFFGYAVGFLSLVLAPLIIFGAIKMMKGQKYGLAMAAAVAAMIPLTSCCFLIGLPVGIWALIVLRKPDVKSMFR